MSTLIRADEVRSTSRGTDEGTHPWHPMPGYLYKRRENHAAEGVAHSLTFSCFGRHPLFANAQIKDRFASHLAKVERVDVLAWVIMPEHVHLIVARREEERLADVLHALKTPFARTILNRWRTLRWPGLARLRDEKGYHFWLEGGGYDRLVYGHELREKIGYLHTNPVRRGLSARPIDYRWSSAAAFEGAITIGPPIAFDLVPQGLNRLT